MYKLMFDSVTIEGVDEIEAKEGFTAYDVNYFIELEENGVFYTPAEKLAIRQGWVFGATVELDGVTLEPDVEHAFWVGIDPALMTFEWIRDRRDKTLRSSDFTNSPDSPLSTGQKQLWQVYRQQLRDLPSRFGDASLVIWPKKPGV